MSYSVHKPIHHILTHCGGLRSQEHALVVYDATTEDIAEAFVINRPIGTGVHRHKVNISHHGEEPDTGILNYISPDLVISLCRYSLAHTRWRQRTGARFLSLPQYSWEVLYHPATMVDYEAQAPVVRRFADAFTDGNEIRVVAEGTDVTMDIAGRGGNYCPGFVRKRGDLGSPPDIEANVAPIEGSARGMWRHDLDMLAECGVGLNPLAKICGNMLIDEGAYGSVHFGFGSNHTIGGARDAGYHVDVVMPNASLWVDGTQMLKEGELC